MCVQDKQRLSYLLAALQNMAAQQASCFRRAWQHITDVVTSPQQLFQLWKGSADRLEIGCMNTATHTAPL